MLLTWQFAVCGGVPPDLDCVMLESTFDCSQAMINTVLHKPSPYILRKRQVFHLYQSLEDVCHYSRENMSTRTQDTVWQNALKKN